MGTLGLALGAAGAAVCAVLFFMVTAFGGGGLVAPGRPPLSPSVGAYLTVSLFGGPFLCAAFGLLPWILFWTGSAPHGAWFAGPPALLALQVLLIFKLFGK